ncbi:hypothetical protein HY498_01040 [Candidatus Woesearchaeota archaeon]|nr:hypothetical protein [Candidatus Woesearchaeota archaeon]
MSLDAIGAREEFRPYYEKIYSCFPSDCILDVGAIVSEIPARKYPLKVHLFLKTKSGQEIVGEEIDSMNHLFEPIRIEFLKKFGVPVTFEDRRKYIDAPFGGKFIVYLCRLFEKWGW